MEPLKIRTWQMPRFVILYFGGRMEGWRIDKGVYHFIGSNNKGFFIRGLNAQCARVTLGRKIATITGTDDKRVKH